MPFLCFLLEEMSFLNTVLSFTIKSLKLLVSGIFAVTAAVRVRNILQSYVHYGMTFEM